MLKRLSISPVLIISFLLSSILFAIVSFGVSSHNSFGDFVITTDNAVHSLLFENAQPVWIAKVMLFFTYLGNTETITATVIIIFILLYIFKRRQLATFFIGGIGGAALLSQFFKYSFGRARPAEILYQVSRHGYSFPSGHALIATIFYGFCAFCIIHVLHKRWQKILVGIIAALVIILVGFSRIYLGVHWVSDVIGGWVLGVAVLSLLIILFHLAHRHLKWTPLKPIHGIALIAVVLLVVALTFFIFHYYVTHELIIRSIV